MEQRIKTTICFHHVETLIVWCLHSQELGANGLNKTPGTGKMTVILLRHQQYVVLFIHGSSTCTFLTLFPIFVPFFLSFFVYCTSVLRSLWRTGGFLNAANEAAGARRAAGPSPSQSAADLRPASITVKHSEKRRLLTVRMCYSQAAV